MTVLSEAPTYDVCGVPIAALTPRAAAEGVVEAAAARERLEVHLCNAYTLSLVDRDERLAAALQRAHLNLPDGTPVAWIGRKHGCTAPVRGPALVREVAALGAPLGIAHYFYGGAAGVAQALGERLSADVPGLVVAGAESPPFGEPTPDALDEAAARMTAAGSSVVWVGLGTPRQDYVVPLLADRLEAVVVPVGAAFDFLTGRVKEAPAVLHGSSLEWVHRLASDPRRLWRRYAVGNPRFLLSALRHMRAP